MELEDGSIKETGDVKVTMLMVINLYVIDKIFKEEAEIKLGAMPQILYINCLTHHFKDKPAKVSSSIPFEIFEEDIKGYETYKKHFQDLHKAGLITIGAKSIVFNNVWGKHIDRSKLEKVSPDEYVAGFAFHTVGKFKDELYRSSNLYELSGMKYKLSKAQTDKLIELFIKEQETFEKTYSNFSDCIRHCIYWIGINSSKVPKEVVKSNSKILGQ